MKCNAIINSFWGTQIHKIEGSDLEWNGIALGVGHSISRVLLNDNNCLVEMCVLVCYLVGQDSTLIPQELITVTRHGSILPSERMTFSSYSLGNMYTIELYVFFLQMNRVARCLDLGREDRISP